MNYHSILRGTIIAFSVTALGAYASHPTAQAASWHKGVPSTIKGTFTNSWFRTDMGTTQGLIEFTNSRFTMSSNLSDLLHGTKLRYKRIGSHTYEVSSIMAGSRTPSKVIYGSHHGQRRISIKFMVGKHWEKHYHGWFYKA